MSARYLTTLSQVESEFAALIETLRAEKVTRFLEIGSRFGGSLWRIAQALPVGSRIVSLDSGKGMGGKKPGATRSLEACIAALKLTGYDARLVVGDSQLAPQIKKVKALAPFDAIFIDADHEYRGVKRDWQNYGNLAPIVAFHDIGWRRPDGYRQGKQVEVPRFWNEIKKGFHYREFIDRTDGGNMGIGVLWR